MTEGKFGPLTAGTPVTAVAPRGNGSASHAELGKA
ncbi:MAG: hypothetical protein JWR45_54 [Blastococcus sp.]|jgi:hypothetical protein|nr:hypothetical protein [Blastococcus sp.]